MLTRLRLIPHDDRFFDLFSQSATNTLHGARLLQDLIERDGDVADLARELKEVEHRGDEITRDVFVALHRTFVTPLDREDISSLASALDDVIDWIEEVGRRLRLYQLGPTPPLARRLARIVLDQVSALNQAVPLLEDKGRAAELGRLGSEIHRLENDADDLLAEAITHVYDGVTEVPELIRAIRWSDVYQLLEDATDKANQAAVVLQNIALKNA
jgi:uncharacterized protein